MKLMLNNVRLSFPKIFTAEGFEGGAPAFSLTAIFPKDHPDLAKWEAAVDQVGSDKWAAKWPEMKKLLTQQDKLPIHDGLNKAHLDGYEGNLFISARSPQRPVVVDVDRTPLTEADGKPYAGCYCNVSVEFWAQDNKYGKRINTKLRGVQFARDGESFSGGGAMNDEEFDVLDVANLI
jgi:hypothetical protein